MVTHQQVATLHQGPLPAPEDLHRYDELLPGAANRIIAMAEREQAHRMNMEDMAQRADIRHREDIVTSQRNVARGAFTSDLLGQAAGAVVALSSLAGAVYTALNGAHPAVSIALVGLPIAAIIKAIRTVSRRDETKKP